MSEPVCDLNDVIRNTGLNPSQVSVVSSSWPSFIVGTSCGTYYIKFHIGLHFFRNSINCKSLSIELKISYFIFCDDNLIEDTGKCNCLIEANTVLRKAYVTLYYMVCSSKYYQASATFDRNPTISAVLFSIRVRTLFPIDTLVSVVPLFHRYFHTVCRLP